MQANLKQSIISFLLSNAQPGKILDIPCGNGWLYNELKDDAWHYYAADMDPATPCFSRNFKSVDLNKSLPYDDNSFDYIACLEGLEHIENEHHVLREFHRILRKKGVLLVSTPNPLNIKSRMRFFTMGTYRGFPHFVKMPSEGEHVHMSPINLSFLISFAKKYGLSLNKVHSIKIKPSMYRYVLLCCVKKIITYLKSISKDKETQVFINRLDSFNILLNDNIFVSFQKE
ncbi:MAG: class I SAM-dependent methyltransferase [Deltaproteobacteria bacterium]|nr:class I SAM-dependent methyltransferase [Deltaproteobacteria bacterium]